jgi:dipeptidase D
VSVLAELEPQGVWERFSELTRIPRPPKQEERVREHVVGWARERGFESEVDAEGNVLVRVPASDGREDAPTIVLQSHLDMVCERDPESPHDARTGAIEVVLDEDWVVADGTTLGADNGIGVAVAMATAEDAAISHGPLELLFTVCEEAGLDGAKALKPSFVTGRLLVNLDGVSDTALTIGCAGATHTFTRFRLEPEKLPAGYATVRVALGGARGGHSGGDVARGRVNAIAALGRVLFRGRPLRLAHLEGGVSRNALPRDASAVVALDPVAEPAFRDAAERELAALRAQFAGTDDALTLAIEPAEAAHSADEATSARALDLLAAIPCGVVAMSPDLPAIVETSTSLTVATTDDGVLSLASMTRSANAQALAEVVARIEAAARLAGAEVEILPSYPPWRPDLQSGLLHVARATFERVNGVPPSLEVVHGGLECAVIGDRLPGIEMIALGPEIVGPHAPGERLSIPATQRFYRLLGALLDDLSR